MRRMTILGAIILLAACSKAPDAGKSQSGQSMASATDTSEAQHLPRVPLVVRHKGGGADSRLSVELALTREQQERGFMHRTDLGPGDGMIFPMVPPRSATFWMKDTPMPLDILFIRTDGSIERVIARAKPNDETPLFVEIPVSGVLELPGGAAAALGVGEGDRINWGACTEGKSPKPVVEPGNFCPG